MNKALPCLLIAGSLLVVPIAPAHAGHQDLHQDQQQCLGPPQKSDPSVPWAQQQLAPQQVWPLTKGAGITVAVVDTGVDSSIPQLSGNVLPGIDLTSPNHGPANTDCYGHGTFVASIIAARALPGTGFVGIAPDVTILPIRVATTDTPNEPGSLTPEGMANGIRQAVDSGAQVINVSASTTEQNSDLQAAVDYAAQHNVVVVAAAANTAQSGNPTTYPAAYPSVIAVGAVDQNDQHADFSQTGPYVSVVAPGVNITGDGPGGPGQWVGSGTSYATPFVCAAAALVRAYRPWLTAAQIKHRLEATADHPAAALPDPALGWGTLNIDAAVTAVLPGEGATQGRLITPPSAISAAAAGLDVTGPLVAVLGVTGAIALVVLLLLASRLVSAGRRRGWRRTRMVPVDAAPNPDGGPEQAEATETPSKLTVDLHPVFRSERDIANAVRTAIFRAAREKVELVEIIPGKGSGKLKQHVLAMLNQPHLKRLYRRVEADETNEGRVLVRF